VFVLFFDYFCFTIMSNMNVEVGDRLMDKISRELGLSECGKAWVTIALDPYHDTPVDSLKGYPDINEAASVVQTVKSSYSVVAPSSAGSGNWDAHICSFPWLNPGNPQFSTNSPASVQTGLFQPDLVTSYSPSPWGGLMVDTVPTGTSTYNKALASAFNLDWAGTTSSYAMFEWRQIGMGFEVINTTSDLNAQGTCTCYRMPFPQRNSKSSYTFQQISASGLTSYTGSVSGVFASAPPNSVAECMVMPGTVQWKAKEGAYVVPTLNNEELAAGTDNTVIFLDDGTSVVTARSIGGYATFSIVGATQTYSIATVEPTGTSLTDFNYGGAYFTGLSNSTILTVNLIRYFERFPAFDIVPDRPLVVLATPSCRNDPQAKELYSAVIRHMPVGVPQRFNGIGDWFREAAQTAKDIISPVLSAIPLPMAQMGASVLNNIGNNLIKKYSNEEKSVEVPPGRIYNAQGNQSSLSSQPKKASVATVKKQLANLGLGKKKKKKTGVIVAKMVKK